MSAPRVAMRKINECLRLKLECGLALGAWQRPAKTGTRPAKTGTKTGTKDRDTYGRLRQLQAALSLDVAFPRSVVAFGA
jgi:hypothetical protein